MKIGHKNQILALVTLSGVAAVSVAVNRQIIETRHIQSGVQVNGMNTELLQYADDHGGVLPIANTTTALIATMGPYGTTDFHAYYDSSVEIKFNRRLSGMNIRAVKPPSGTVSFYEAKPDIFGQRWVAYLDKPTSPQFSDDPGFDNVRFANARQWESIRRSIQ